MDTSSSHIRRFHCSDLATVDPDGGTIELNTIEAHHAANVLRLKPGAEVELFDGAGLLAAGRIAGIKRSCVAVEISGKHTCPPLPGPGVHLAFAVPKGKRLDWLLEKAGELGVTSIQPVICERSVSGTKDLSEGKLAKWMGHCISAAKQCGVNFLPEIRPPASFGELMQNSADALGLLGDLSDASTDLSCALARRGREQDIRILIGPEGDFTDRERTEAMDAGYLPVRIGPTVLRVETAAICMLAAVNALVR